MKEYYHMYNRTAFYFLKISQVLLFMRFHYVIRDY
jgi:hypothetical protein